MFLFRTYATIIVVACCVLFASGCGQEKPEQAGGEQPRVVDQELQRQMQIYKEMKQYEWQQQQELEKDQKKQRERIRQADEEYRKQKEKELKDTKKKLDDKYGYKSDK